MLGIAPLPRPDRFIRRRVDQPIEVARQPGSVDRHGIGFFDALDGAPLHEQPLDRVERRQFVMVRLQCPYLGCDPEQLADEIFEMGREIDQQVGFVEALDDVRAAPRRHQPVVQTDLGFGKMGNKCPIQPNETVAIIKIGEREPVLEGEVGHRDMNATAGAAPSILVSGGDAATPPKLGRLAANKGEQIRKPPGTKLCR